MILFCPDSFKGCVHSSRLCRDLDIPDVTSTPLGDGGEGFVDVMSHQPMATRHTVTIPSLDGGTQEADYVVVGDTAYVEVASAIGHRETPPGPITEIDSTPFGKLLHAVLGTGLRNIVVAGGGTATHDGGVGMLSALGARFEDKRGFPAPWLNFEYVARYHKPPKLYMNMTFLCDVNTTFLGSIDVFAPQKGATPEDIPVLKQRFEKLMLIYQKKDKAYYGVGGGLAMACRSQFKANLVKGFEFVAKTLKLEDKIKQAHLVITGEGRLDNGTLEGKGIASVAALCRKHNKPLEVICGSWDGHTIPAGVRSIHSLETRFGRDLDATVTQERVRALLGARL